MKIIKSICKDEMPQGFTKVQGANINKIPGKILKDLIYNSKVFIEQGDLWYNKKDTQTSTLLKKYFPNNNIQ